MTACFLFSAAGSESPSFNYFHNFADPVSVPLCQRKWDLQQRPSTASAAFGSFKMRKFIKLRILYKILLTFHLLSFSHSRPPPLQNTPAWSSSALPISWPSSRRNSGELNNLIPTLHPHLSLCLPVLLLTQQGLLGSRQTGVILLSANPSYPGRGLGSTETVRAKSWGHKAQINRDER